MPPIKPLPPALVNKIAAGEVIERPASVVKELVENALDAGATRIDVALEAGGSKLIRVSDNGCGIPCDDLPLAVAAHATSKIYSDDDLFNIRTLGFRGEALASIASVSQLRIVSRTADQLEAYELAPAVTSESPNCDPHSAIPNPHAQIRNPQSPSPCAAPPGTTVEVRNLFYNVPARRKFLRQPQTECGHATEQIARLALAHPNVAFTLSHNGRSLRNLPPTADRRERIADFYGAELAECLLDIKRDERGLGIDALIAPPAQSRATTKWQYLFLNGRYITDRRIGYAIREAFRGLVEPDRFPVLFIFLSADPQEFDVNVHPTKIEVRWRDAGLVQSQVLSALRETLLSHDLTPALGLQPSAVSHQQSAVSDQRSASDGAGEPSGWRSNQGVPAARERARQALADYLKRIDPTQARLSFRPPPFATDRLRPSIASTFSPPDDSRRGFPGPAQDATRKEERFAEADENRPSGPTAVKDSVSAGKSTAAEEERPSAYPTGFGPSAVMQVHNTYLVAQTEEGVIIVDQHALHERILYERFRDRLLQGPLESQGLLIPETLDVSPAQAEAANAQAALLDRLGIELSPFGPKAMAVQRFPMLLHNVDIRTFVSDLLDRLAESEGAASEETLVHAALDMMACRAAVKAGDVLSIEEIYALLDQRHLTQRSSNCPHGRPTTLELTTKDLERQFKRI